MLTLVNLADYESVSLKSLLVTSVIAFIEAVISFGIFAKQWRLKRVHRTARYVQCYTSIANIIFEGCGVAYGILASNNDGFTLATEILIFILLMIAFEHRFSPIIAIIDFSLRCKHPLSYGETKRSLQFVGLIKFITITISVAVSYCAFWAEGKAGTVIIVALVLAGIMQFIGVLLTLHFYKKSKTLRINSIDKCSLAEKHEIHKNIYLLKLYIPLAIIEAFFGTTAILATTLAAIITGSVIFASTLFFTFFNLAVITNTSLLLINIMTVIFQSRNSGRTKYHQPPKVTVVKTILHSIPARETHDDHFKTLKFMWK